MPPDGLDIVAACHRNILHDRLHDPILGIDKSPSILIVLDQCHQFLDIVPADLLSLQKGSDEIWQRSIVVLLQILFALSACVLFLADLCRDHSRLVLKMSFSQILRRTVYVVDFFHPNRCAAIFTNSPLRTGSFSQISSARRLSASVMMYVTIFFSPFSLPHNGLNDLNYL